MKKDFTRIAVVLDRSGSMDTIRQATIDGFNEFVNQQKTLPGTVTLKLAQFDDIYEVVFDRYLSDVPKLTDETFVPRGMTALQDAMGRTIVSLGADLARKRESERPDKVLVVVITDGGENMSVEYPGEGGKARIASMIKHQTDKYNWNFVFIGANQDAVLTAKSYNIPAGSALNYNANAASVKGMTRSLSNYTTSFRSGVCGQSVGFTDEDRQNADVTDANKTSGS